MNRGRLCTWVVLLALTATGVRAGGPDLELRTFLLSDAADDRSAAQFYGLELRVAVSNSKWYVTFDVPAVTVNGPVTVVGPGIPISGDAPGNSPPSGSEPSGPGQGPGPSSDGSQGSLPTDTGPQGASISGPGSLDGSDTIGVESLRRSGLGDIRVQANRLLGPNRPWGRLAALAGVKVPTADESQGLGSGKTDGWVGVNWSRQGWNTDVSAYLEWVALGDLDTLELRDGPGTGFFVDRIFARNSVGGGVRAARSPLRGEPALVSLVLAGQGTAGRRLAWRVEASTGLTDSTPTFGLLASLRFVSR